MLGDPVSVNVFEQIDATCREFRSEWKQGRRPSIVDFLTRVAGNARSNLFRNLLHTEIEFRRRAKENPTSEEYLRRFPEFAPLVRQAFYESTMMSLAEFQNTPPDAVVLSADEEAASAADGRTMSFAIPAANRLGDYRLLRELGRGGFGIVYAAQHVRRHEIVALKTLPLGDQRHGLDDAERLHKFRREFRSLADINHPNLVGMQTLEVDGGQWFFTMDLVDGVDFLNYVRPDGELNEARLRGVLPQLAAGIMALHARHIIHRDLKPSNVLVDANGKVVILDFGLVAELEQGGDQTQSLASGRFAGTPLYAAPEQMFGQRSAASDWYALGIMLYQALTDERPFHGSVVEIMQQKQQQSAPDLGGRDGLPADLADLTDRLLAKEPDRRPDALEIAKVLSINAGETPTATYLEEGSTLTPGRDQALIGRERQLSELDLANRQFLMTRQPLALLITGRSGEGKTSLAEAFLAPVRKQREMLVLAGRCYDRESVPFKAIDCLIDALVSFLRGCPGEVVQAAIPDDMPMLAHLFPILRRVEAIGALPSSNAAKLDGKQVRDRGFAALRQMLVRIGQRQPIALFVDDLQWGDADSAAVLHRLLSPPEAPAVLLLGTYRSDEAAESPFLQQWEKLSNGSQTAVAQREIAVGPLSEAQCVAMVVGRIGIDNESIRSQAVRLFRDTGGNPYFIEQLIECFDPDTGSFTPAPLQVVIANRLKKLPQEATSLLEVIAVFGKAISIAEAFQVNGQSQPSFATITHMRTERLVRLLGSEEQRTVDTYHDKIRETVIEKLDLPIRQKLHRRIAEAIEQSEQINFAEMAAGVEQPQAAAAVQPKLPVRVFDLAYHFDAAGESKKALVYALFAAEESKRQFALDVACGNFAIAERHMRVASRGLRFRKAIGHGESLVQAGRFEEAAQVLEGAVELTDDQLEKSRVRILEADIVCRTKSLHEGIARYEQVLRELGVWVPKTRFGLAIAFLGELTQRAVRRLLPKGWYLGKDPQDKKTALIINLLAFYLTYSYYFRNTIRQAWAAHAGVNRAERQPNSPLLAAAYNQLATTRLFLGFRSFGLKYCERALKISTDLKDLMVQANTLRDSGGGLLTVGDLDAGLLRISQAAELYQTKVPEFFRLLFCRLWICEAHYRLGNLDKCREMAPELFRLTIQYGLDRPAQIAIELWSRVYRGQLPFDELKCCFQPDPDDFLGTILLYRGETHWHLGNARTQEAVEAAEKAYSIFKRRLVVNHHTASTVSDLANALQKHAEFLSNTDSAEYSRVHNRALRMARRAVRVTWFLQIDYAASLREYSLALDANGRTRKAYKYAKKSTWVAQHQGAKYEYAQSLLVLGQVGEKLGRPEARQQIEQATAALVEFDRQRELATAQSFDSFSIPESLSSKQS